MAPARGLQLYREPALLPTHAVRSTGVLDVVKTYRRHVGLFLLVAGTIFALFAAYTLLRTRDYTAIATLLIAPKPSAIGDQQGSPLSDPSSDASVDTQVEVLKSPALAALVVDRLGLATPNAFHALTDDRSPFTGILPSMPSNAPRHVQTDADRRASAVEKLGQIVNVRRTAQTFALDVSVTHPDAAFAQRVANTVATLYIDQSLSTKRDSSRTGSDLLRGQLAAARREVEQAEQALGRYKVAHNLMSVNGYTLAEQQLSSLQDQVATARAGAAEANARYETARRQIARGSTGDNLGEALNSPTVQQLRSQRADLSSKVADLSGRFGDRYPPLSTARRQLTDIDGQIQGEINRTVSSLASQRDAAAQRVASLAASAASAQGAVADNNLSSVDMNALQLRAQTARDSYSKLLDRVNEIGTQTSTVQPDARIASLAPLPSRPSAPNIPINLLVGALLGIACGIVAVFLRQGTEHGLRTLEDVETRLQLPYLAGLPTAASSIPNFRGDNPVEALLEYKASAFAEGYRSLGASILQSGSDDPVRTIALTSALPNEGKTTAAIGLVRTLAFSGTSVVLVDADLRHPSVAEALGITVQAGLQEVIEGQVPLEAALVRDPDSGAFFLPMLKADKAGTAALLNGRFDAVVDALKARFDIVVFDASPVLPVIDGRLVAKKADQTVLLVRWRKTPDTAVELAVHLLEMLGAKLRGIALTRVDLQELVRTGHGDPASYVGPYSSYYAV